MPIYAILARVTDIGTDHAEYGTGRGMNRLSTE